MKNLRPETLSIVERVQAISGRSIKFKPDNSMSLRASLKIARNGATHHVLSYRPNNDPIDYWVAYQAGYALRLFELPEKERFDFFTTQDGVTQVKTLLTTGNSMDEDQKADLDKFSELVTHWSLMNLRSFAIGIRIDQWIHDEYPSLRELQTEGINFIQQENLQVLAKRFGSHYVPVPLIAPLAAYALFVDQLFQCNTYSIPYRAAGVIELGEKLFEISCKTPNQPSHDCELINKWAKVIGMSDWYRWMSFKV